MRFWTLLTAAIFPALLFAQSVEVKPIRLKSHTHSKIMGVHDSTLLVLTSKQKISGEFFNRPYVCDSSMAFKDEQNAFFSKKSCSDDWTFFLKDKVYLMQLHSSDLKSFQRFYIKTMVFMNGVAQNFSTDIFDIDARKDGKRNS